MPVTSLSLPVAAGGHRAPSRCLVDPGMLRAVKARGIDRPVRGMCDAQDGCSQVVEYGPENARRIITDTEGHLSEEWR